MSTLEVAYQIALKAHKNQKRKDGEDYINHCIRVSKEAEKISLDAAIVGMLHDVVEDSDITFGDLVKENFNPEIIRALHYITKEKSESYLNYILEMKYYEHLPFAKLARSVKSLDIKDNLNGAKGTLKDKYQLAYYILTGEDISK